MHENGVWLLGLTLTLTTFKSRLKTFVYALVLLNLKYVTERKIHDLIPERKDKGLRQNFCLV